MGKYLVVAHRGNIIDDVADPDVTGISLEKLVRKLIDKEGVDRVEIRKKTDC